MTVYLNKRKQSGYTIGYLFNKRIYRSRPSSWSAEYHLHGLWLAIAIETGGLLTYGLTLHYHKHWIGLAFGWLLVVAGMISSMV